MYTKEYEANLLSEIWGCIKHVGIPYDTVMSMPVYLRKNFIMKHNEEVGSNFKSNTNRNSTITGAAINSFAELEQKKGG